MTKFLATLITVFSLFVVMTGDVEARRMGGGKSFGKQSSNVTRQQAPATKPSATNPASTTSSGAAAKPASPWKGMLGGALLGLGLGALLSSFGIGAGMANIISMLLMAGIAVAAVMFLARLLKPKTATMRNAYAGPAEVNATPEIGSRIADISRSANMSDATWEIPAGFDVPQFERTAQSYFIRLQAAWDKADINDIREFTTPEMYAEVKLQIQERGAASSFTDVMTVSAKLLGIETQASNYLASVKFVGTMKEEVDGPTISFEEVWNLSKAISGQSGWLLAGIQQVE
jgi:predicted lipid-binding transport protein (Tim44 family)